MISIECYYLIIWAIGCFKTRNRKPEACYFKISMSWFLSMVKYTYLLLQTKEEQQYATKDLFKETCIPMYHLPGKT